MRVALRRSWWGALVVIITALLVPSAGAATAAPASAQDLQARIDEADPGSTLEVEGGRYAGGIVIDKPLTLVGRGRPVIDAGGEGDVVQVKASDVTIQGFVIRGSGTAVTNADGGVVVRNPAEPVSGLRVIDNQIEDVLYGLSLDRVTDSELRGNQIVGKDLGLSRRGDSIRLYESHRMMVEGNDIRLGRDLAMWYSTEITLRDNRFEQSRYGLHSMFSSDLFVDRNVFRDNFVGAFLMYGGNLRIERNLFSESNGPSGYGLALKDVDGADVVGNRFLDNRVGIFNDNSPGKPGITHHVVNNVFAFNVVGVLLMPAVQHNVFSDNAFIDNTDQVALTGPGVLRNNEWSLDGRGNFWSDYAGYDADRDGIGDREYRVDDLFSSMKDNHPNLVFFTGTPAARAVDMAGRAFPDLRPQPKLVDEHPLVVVPDFPPMIDTGETSSEQVVLVASVLMLAVAGAILAMTRTWRGPGATPA